MSIDFVKDFLATKENLTVRVKMNYSNILYAYFEQYQSLNAFKIQRYLSKYAEATIQSYARIFRMYVKFLDRIGKLELSKEELDKIERIGIKRKRKNIEKYPMRKEVKEYLDFKISFSVEFKENVEYVLANYFRQYKKLNADKIKEFVDKHAPLTQHLYLRYFKGFIVYLREFDDTKISKMEYKRVLMIPKKKGGRVRLPRNIKREIYQQILQSLSGDLGLGTSWFIAWNFGLRPQEVITLQIEDIDFEKGLLHVKRRLKTESSLRSIPIDPIIVPRLKKIIGKRKTGCFVLNSKNRPYKNTKTIDACLRKYRIKHCKHHFTFYSGRYSFCTRQYYEIGVSLGTLAIFMGHSKVETTARYLDIDLEKATNEFREKNKF